MDARAKVLIAVIITLAVWLGVLFKLGLWKLTVTPADGYLSRTFNGWAEQPISRHLFLMQLQADDFAQGKPYTSATYPFIFFNFLFLAPFHFLLRLPYNLAHNFLPYFYVFCLVLLLILTTKRELLAISKKRSFLLWLVVFISIGITVADPLPWTSSFNANRDNPHILAAGTFCYLSTWVFHNKIPKTPLLIAGVFLALWTPMYIPAWILSGLFFHRTLLLNRKWIAQVVAVSALAFVNVELPALVCRVAGLQPNGSSFLFRSGLDGSTTYMTSIFQAIYSPNDPRHWHTGSYLVLTALLALCFHYFYKDRKYYRPLHQALFLLIPYATLAIFLPQLTSIHPYISDLFLVIPATFLMSFWFLQKPFWRKFAGPTFVTWFIVASLILMTNLLYVAQMP